MVKVNEKLRESDMSDLTEEGGGLSKLSAAELAQAYVESVQAAEATEHIGRKNRLARRQWQIVRELNGRPEGRSVLQRLADHSDEAVREGATSSLAWLDKPTPQPEPQQPKGKFWPNVIWQCDQAKRARQADCGCGKSRIIAARLSAHRPIPMLVLR
jgi:hypothetical protein